VAILGAGGIGFDVAAFLTEDFKESTHFSSFSQAWGIDLNFSTPGGVLPIASDVQTSVPRRELVMLQRSPDAMGKNLGRTTGWIHKAKLKRASVKQVVGATYLQIDDAGLHYKVNNETHVLQVDHIVLCTGQLSNTSLHHDLQLLGVEPHLIGGVEQAAELDALRAIAQATRLALTL
jgi:2,4-dienoyl-CoA reductase (NADPH2)